MSEPMSKQQSTQAQADAQFPDQSFSQTHPLALSDYTGADHRGKCRLSFDWDGAANRADDAAMKELLDWSVEALNAVTRYPNLALWVRSPEGDLLLSHHPVDGHERAGHLRAASWLGRNHEGTLALREPTDTGIVTVFDVANALYDIVAGVYDVDSVSVVLGDVAYLESVLGGTPASLEYSSDLLAWGRNQLSRPNGLPLTPTRTALPKSVYPDPPGGDEHDHAEAVLKQHVQCYR
jgi:hypothetical protein